MLRVLSLAVLFLAGTCAETKVHKTRSVDDIIASVDASIADVDIDEDTNLDLEEEASDNEKEKDVEADSSESPSREMEKFSGTVVSDIDRLLSVLEQDPEIPAHVFEQARVNLRALRSDAQQLSTASPSRISMLKHAVHKRFDALKTQLLEFSPNSEDYSDIPNNKVEHDIKQISAALEESHLSNHLLRAANDDVKKLAVDAQELASASPAHASELKKAMKLRVQALKRIVADSDAPSVSDDVANPLVSKIETDVLSLEDAISTIGLSNTDKTEAMENLKAIKRDAEHLLSATGAKRERLQNAVNLRMQALKFQLNEAETTQVTPHHLKPRSASGSAHSQEELIESRIPADIKRVQEQVKATHLSAATRKKVNDNLAHIMRDAEEIVTAPEHRKRNLLKSIQLRTSVLKTQLHE